MLTAVDAIVQSCPQRKLYLILCLSIWQGIQRREGERGEGEGGWGAEEGGGRGGGGRG